MTARMLSLPNRVEAVEFANAAELEILSNFARTIKAKEENRPWAAYAGDPIGYCTNVLGVQLTEDQQEIMLATEQQPFKVHVDSGHSTGKSFLAACIINYRYDSYDPGVVVCTAPTFEYIMDVLWGRVRTVREGARKLHPNIPMDFGGPRMPSMRSSPDHYAVGLTAAKGEAFQGKHYEYMFFLFDEAEGLAQPYFTTTASMFVPGGKHGWLSLDNPTSVSSPAYLETRKVDNDGNPLWNLFRLSSLEHPNIPLGLQGKPPLIEGAVTAGQIDIWIHDYYCEIVEEKDSLPTDFEWRGQWYRPGPDAESRILGLRPSQGTASVWNDAIWAACESMSYEAFGFPLDEMPEIGCDVARVLGGDDCDIHVRWGGVSLKHESANGRPVLKTALRLKELAQWACDFSNRMRLERYNELPSKDRKGEFKPFLPHKIPVKIDDCNAGGTVVELSEGYNFIPVNAGSVNQEHKYPNLRSELWFETAERARLGGLCLSYMAKYDKRMLQKLRIQAMSPLWTSDARQRRVLEKKEVTKKRLGSSPDAIDAFNLAYLPASGTAAHMIGQKPTETYGDTAGARLGLLGRGHNIYEDRDVGRRERDRKVVRTLGRGSV